MKFRMWWPTVGLLAFLVGSAISQGRDAKDVAELMPAQTLAYVEVRQPDKLAREIEVLLKGSAIEDMPATMARFRAKLKSSDRFYGAYQFTELGMFLSPEVLRDLSKVRGGAVAITGFTKDGPEYVAVLLTGDSNFARLMTRASMTFGQMHIVQEVGGVNIYREKSRPYVYKKPPRRIEDKDRPYVPPPPPPIEERGPAIAMTSSMIVLGSRKELVADVLLRARGKASDPPLASLSAYKDAAKLRERPGLFFYADPAAIEAQMDRLGKEPGGVPREWKSLRAALPPKAVRSATGMLTLQNGNLHLQTQINLVPGTRNALLDALPNRRAATELLAFAPRNTMLTGVVGFEDGSTRWSSLVKLLDDVARASGAPEAGLPGKGLEDLEKVLELKIGKDVLGRISSAGALVNIEDGKAPPSTPMLLVRAKDAEAATFLSEKALPRLVEVRVGGKVGAPVVEKVLGQSITTLSAGLLASWKETHIGKQGPNLVVGPNKMRVAESLLLADKKAGALTDVRVETVLKGLDNPVGVAVVSLAQPLTSLFKSSITPMQRRYSYKDVKDGPPRPAPMKTPDYVEKSGQEMAKALSTLTPLVFSMERKANTIILEARQPSLRGATGRAINVWVEGELRKTAYDMEPRATGFPKETERVKETDKVK